MNTTIDITFGILLLIVLINANINIKFTEQCQVKEKIIELICLFKNSFFVEIGSSL